MFVDDEELDEILSEIDFDEQNHLLQVNMEAIILKVKLDLANDPVYQSMVRSYRKTESELDRKISNIIGRVVEEKILKVRSGH